MESLRILMECYPPTIGYQQLSDGTLWQGLLVYLLMDIRKSLPNYDIVTEQSNRTGEVSRFLQTLVDNRSDVGGDTFGITYKR